MTDLPYETWAHIFELLFFDEWATPDVECKNLINFRKTCRLFDCISHDHIYNKLRRTVRYCITICAAYNEFAKTNIKSILYKSLDTEMASLVIGCTSMNNYLRIDWKNTRDNNHYSITLEQNDEEHYCVMFYYKNRVWHEKWITSGWINTYPNKSIQQPNPVALQLRDGIKNNSFVMRMIELVESFHRLDQ